MSFCGLSRHDEAQYFLYPSLVSHLKPSILVSCCLTIDYTTLRLQAKQVNVSLCVVLMAGADKNIIIET